MFQSTRPRGARRGRWPCSAISSAMFQSTRPRGARLCPSRSRTAPGEFQSTRPRGARLCPTTPARLIHAVSIHAPAWGATFFFVAPLASRMCFNPRARVGRDDGSHHAASREYVSIHAPAWGATLLSRSLCALQTVSIHAPAWGATSLLVSLPPQPGVSIHAPAWGATRSDHARSVDGTFQSTRPRGARRLARCARADRRLCFNPRARVGRDVDKVSGFRRFSVSIHAPAWGATCLSTKMFQA